MVRADQIYLKNLSRHVDIPGDLDIHLYAFNGNLYTRKYKESPRLVAGLVINETSTGSGTTSDNVRAGRTLLSAAGVHAIIFLNTSGGPWTLGITGDDYNLYFDVYDDDNAVPSYTITNRTRFGFYVITYSSNVNFGWRAELNTQ